MNEISTIRTHRNSMLSEGMDATFQVPLVFSKAFEGKYTNSLGDIKTGRLIEGIASTEDKDQQGEIVMQDKMDCSYLLEKGYLNWNHSHSPEDQIGKPLEVIKLPGGPNTPHGLPATFFRALLFDNMARSEAVWNLSKALEDSSGVGIDRSLGFSVEGGVRVRQGTILVETIVRHMAATHEPVNAQAVARCVMAKSQGFNVQDTVMIDTLDDNVPHFIFKDFGQMMKSLSFAISPDPIGKTFALGNVSSGAPALLREQLVAQHGYGKKKKLKKSSTTNIAEILEMLYDPCEDENNCKENNAFIKGYHGALDHLVYCCGVEPMIAVDAIAKHAKMFS